MDNSNRYELEPRSLMIARIREPIEQPHAIVRTASDILGYPVGDAPPAFPQGDRVRTDQTALYGVEGLPSGEISPNAMKARELSNWGPLYEPPTRKNDYQNYRRILDELVGNIEQLRPSVTFEGVGDDAAAFEAEIQNLLETLYDCAWGEGESLKSAVVAIQSQLNNAIWTTTQFELLSGSIALLRSRYVVDTGVVDAIYDLVEQLGLEQFRGTITASDVKWDYELVRKERGRD
jgi:hypothetical protein